MLVVCAGLCQAKIAAAELWRAYSEHYRSHQARHPVMSVARSNHLQQQMEQHQMKLSEVSDCVESLSPAQSHSVELVGFEKVPVVSPQESVDDDGVGRHDNDDATGIETGRELAGEDSIASSNSSSSRDDDDVDDEFEVEGVDVLAQPAVWNECEDGSDSHQSESPTPASVSVTRCGSATTEDQTNTTSDDLVASQTNVTSDNINTLPQNVRSESGAGLVVSQGIDAVSVYQQGVHMQLYSPGVSTDIGLRPGSPNSSLLAPPPLKTPKKSPGERQSSAVDYRRSERGLSFLFPSFSDHGMSLLDKVRITVARHKNNYFLGWTTDQLSRLDPVVRPKVPVTPAVYREYCHRNAMKYDSNLQFACESPEPWAAEFRARLTLPPADGGFTSLCEVKLEAGRLWREHSGRYRMHNIVKWQMGMNSAVLANGSAVTASARPGRARGKTSPSTTVEQQLTPSCTGLDQHHLSSSAASFTPRQPVFTSSAVSVTVPLSVTNSPPVNPVCCPPRFSGPTFVVSKPAACSVRLDSSTTPSGDVLDMSTASTAAGPLFEPLPDEMPAASQLRVWLERHRSGYFVNSPQLSVPSVPVVDYVRPRLWPVTPALLNAEIPPGVVEVLAKINHLLSLPVDQLPAPARRFRERLNAPPRSADAFVTFEEAVTEALSAWNTVVGGGEGRARSNGNCGDAATRHGKRKLDQTASSSAVPCTGSASTAGVIQTSTNGGREPLDCIISDDDDDDDDDGLVVALPPSCSPSPAHSQCPSPVCPSPVSLGVDLVQQLLWSSRSSLHDACVQNPQQSWDERLEPLRPTLASNLGLDYVVPSQSQAATVDLVLAALHRRLDDLARSQTHHSDHDVEQLPKEDASPQ